MATGFDNRNGAGLTGLQLVSPTIGESRRDRDAADDRSPHVRPGADHARARGTRARRARHPAATLRTPLTMSWLRTSAALAAGIALLGLQAPAHARPGTFTATIGVQIGSLPPVVAMGSGTADVGGSGGHVSWPAGIFSIVTTAPINPPLLVIDGFGIGAPGQVGTGQLPLAPGSNQALHWNGVSGTMGLDLSAYLITGYASGMGTTPNNQAAIPLAIVGVGGTQKFVALGGLIMGSIMANPYQLGMVTVMGNLNGVPSTLMGTGFDNRTIDGEGTLQLVSPTMVSLGALGSLAALTTVTGGLFSHLVPEPATLSLVAVGFAALGAMRRRCAPR